MTSKSIPSPQELLLSALTTAAVGLLPGRFPPQYPIPLRCGVPVAQGKLADEASAWLIGPNGEVLPAQTEVLSRWPDGSARWVLVDVMLPLTPSITQDWTVVFSRAALRPNSPTTLEADDPANRAALQHKVLQVDVDSTTGRCDVLSAGSGLRLVSWQLPVVLDADGQLNAPVLRTHRWEVSGAIRATCSFEADYPTLRGLRLVFRQTHFAETGLICTDICWHNPHRARHTGGLWDLGDPGSILFQEASWTVDISSKEQQQVEYRIEPHSDWQDSSSEFFVHQESSGGEHWNSINHVDRTGAVPLRSRGYTLQTATASQTGWRAEPTVRLSGPSMRLCGVIPHFWEQFPKSLAVAESEITFGLFPKSSGQIHELQGGERKTHTVWLKIDPPGTNVDQADLSWVHDPPRLAPVLEDQEPIRNKLSKRVARPESSKGVANVQKTTPFPEPQGVPPDNQLSIDSVANSQPVVPGWPRLTKLDAASMARLDSLCDETLNGPASVFVRREEIDEYGWRNFGEFFADHETVYYRGRPPLISHYNNQYDVLGGLLLQGLRTKNRQWFDLADDLMRHVTDIDLYHTDEDRAVYNGGLFWLTDHYTSNGTATHRTFSKLNAAPGKPYGGGPAGEHNYTSGLLAYYWLTGEPAAREAVTQSADWVSAMEDGRKTIFGLIDDGPTGVATATSQPDYHGPGRGAGNSINSLLDAWLLTGHRMYLQTAEQFIRRCIHPADDIAARDLLNFELRWSYTVFLMALFKYLQCKEELGEFNGEFEYARQSLLHYARWMADDERPYFDRVEQMEFPTETWGAQELRKANVLRWAAVYAEDDALRTRLRTRGDELAERAWHDLCRFPTRTFIRPFTLAMIQGLWDAALRGENHVCEQHGSAPASWGEPLTFVHQKSRVKQMLKSPRGLCTAMLRALNPRRWGPFLDAARRMM